MPSVQQAVRSQKQFGFKIHPPTWNREKNGRLKAKVRWLGAGRPRVRCTVSLSTEAWLSAAYLFRKEVSIISINACGLSAAAHRINMHYNHLCFVNEERTIFCTNEKEPLMEVMFHGVLVTASYRRLNRNSPNVTDKRHEKWYPTGQSGLNDRYSVDVFVQPLY